MSHVYLYITNQSSNCTNARHQFENHCTTAPSSVRKPLYSLDPPSYTSSCPNVICSSVVIGQLPGAAPLVEVPAVGDWEKEVAQEVRDLSATFGKVKRWNEVENCRVMIWVSSSRFTSCGSDLVTVCFGCLLYRFSSCFSM